MYDEETCVREAQARTGATYECHPVIVLGWY